MSYMDISKKGTIEDSKAKKRQNIPKFLILYYFFYRYSSTASCTSTRATGVRYLRKSLRSFWKRNSSTLEQFRKRSSAHFQDSWMKRTTNNSKRKKKVIWLRASNYTKWLWMDILYKEQLSRNSASKENSLDIHGYSLQDWNAKAGTSTYFWNEKWASYGLILVLLRVFIKADPPPYVQNDTEMIRHQRLLIRRRDTGISQALALRRDGHCMQNTRMRRCMQLSMNIRTIKWKDLGDTYMHVYRERDLLPRTFRCTAKRMTTSLGRAYFYGSRGDRAVEGRNWLNSGLENPEETTKKE